MPCVHPKYSIPFRAAIDADALDPLRRVLNRTRTVTRQQGRIAASLLSGAGVLTETERQRYWSESVFHTLAAEGLDQLWTGLLFAASSAVGPQLPPHLVRAYDLANHVSPDPVSAREALRVLRAECETLRLELASRQRLESDEFIASDGVHVLLGSD